MKGKTAGIIFLGICLLLAGLLILKVVASIAGAIIFAAALVIFGLMSNSFRKK